MPDLTLAPFGAGDKSVGILAPAAIDEESMEKENLSEDPAHTLESRHSEKASSSVSRTKLFQECIQQIISRALIDMKDRLFGEISRGRCHLKIQKEGIPTALRIYGKETKYGQCPKTISLTTVPQGVLTVWMADYQDASLPSQRDVKVGKYL